ncbi:MAG: aminotransferase class I/II-fold pyridoxal phosphate-dependent enzyme [Butyrivibrio sp.]
MGELTDKLTEYNSEKIYPFHMPGHKRNINCCINPYRYDITEITGFDNLEDPRDILKGLERRIAALYGCDEAYISVNGSTSCILAAVSAVFNPGDTILMGRNSHKSAYNAAYIRQLKAEYLFPETDDKLGISLPVLPEQVENILAEKPKIKAVYITSPTYEGIISDIRKIADICHRQGAVLIVDAAHGAHLGIMGNALSNPVNLGADITVMSLHKTLPAPTQTAVLCFNRGIAEGKRLRRFINIYNSSSPSYLLMCGIEKCLDMIESDRDLFSRYYINLSGFRRKCRELNNLQLFSPQCSYDEGKIVIGTAGTGLSGQELKDLLRDKYNLELEMSQSNYALAMTSVMDTEESFIRLYNALKETDAAITQDERRENGSIQSISREFSKKYEIYQADILPKEMCDIEDSAGRICGDFLYIYPPGIPWLVPGEIITKEAVYTIVHYGKQGFDIRGLKNNKIQVIEGN